MPVVRDIPISFTAKQVLTDQGLDVSQRSVVAAAERAIALGRDLWSPALAYEHFEMLGIGPDSVSIASSSPGSPRPQKLTIGPKVELLAPARRLLAAAYTIGPALGEKVGELGREGDLLLSYMLDSVGVLALGAVGERVHMIAEEAAVASGWGVGAALSPGSLVGWSIRGQRELCGLLPLEEIGVQLNRYAVLEPHKSASVVIGMGPDFESHEVGSVCRYCALQDRCWRRRGNDQ